MNIFFPLLCFVSFVSLGTSSTIRDYNEDLTCARGPVFWCKSISNAKSCHAITHCIQTVWEKRNNQEDDKLGCNPCTDMIDFVRNKSLITSSPPQIISLFLKYCDSIEKNVCDNLVKSFSTEMEEILNSKMSSFIVCATTNLCNILKEREISKPSNCYKCNQLQSELIKKFSAVESNDILNEVLNKCSQMPLPDSEACSNFVLSNFNDIYGAIKNGLSTNDYCKMTNLCTYEVRYSNDLELNELNIEEFSCKLCELLFQQLKDHTIANLTVSQFKSNLDKFCHKQHNFENICLNTVQQFYIPLYDFVSKLNDIKGMCHLIGACQRKADTYTQVIDSSKEIILELKLNLKCLLCKNVIHLTKSILGNRNSRVEINHALLSTCDKLKSLGKICRQFVSKNLDHLIEKLEQKMDARHICMDLKACKNKFDMSSTVDGRDQKNIPIFIDFETLEQQEASESNTKVLSGISKCRACQELENLIKNSLENAISKESVKKALINGCAQLKFPFNIPCKYLVQQLSKPLIVLIQQQLNASQVCSKLKLCSFIKLDKLESYEDTIGLDESHQSCMICEFVVKRFDSVLEDPKTEKQLKSVIHRFCSMLPQSIEKQCNHYDELYFDFAYKLIEQFLKPKQVCSTLHLCPTSNTDEYSSDKFSDQIFNGDYDNMFIRKRYEIVENSAYSKGSKFRVSKCRICSGLINLVKKTLGNRNSEPAIKRALSIGCSQMGFPFNFPCKILVRQFSGPLIHLIQQHLSSAQICRKIRICSSSKYLDDPIVEQNSDENTENLDNNQRCFVCELFISKAKSMMTDPNFEKDFKSMINDVCTNLPNDFRQHCVDYTKQYFDIGLALFKKFIASPHACVTIHLCPVSYSSDQADTEPCKGGFQFARSEIETKILDENCAICELTVSNFELMLNDADFKQTLKSHINTVCEIFSENIQAICQEYLYNLDDTFKTLENFLATQNFCNVNFCSITHSSTLDIKDMLPCDACTENVAKCANLVDNQDLTLENRVEIIVSILCDENVYCVELTQSYGVGIINLLNSSTKRGEFCYNLGVCTTY